MKVENINNKIIVYLFDNTIDISNINELNNKIKSIFIKLMKRYNYDFFGCNKVNVYHNKYYGLILEVEKLSNMVFNSYAIDLKITIYKDVLMYLEFDDYYFLDNIKSLNYHNGKYYLKINNQLDYNKYLEFAKIKYKK